MDISRIGQKGIGEPLWQTPEAVPLVERPGELWGWLTEQGSLTERMRRACGPEFNVHVLREHETRMNKALVLLLKVTSSTAWQREVYLRCAQTPWVYASTLMPKALSSASSNPWLLELQGQALGDALSTRGGIRRSKLAIAELSSQHSLFRSATLGCSILPGKLWARRSLVAVEGGHLVIQECFLPQSGTPAK